MIRIVDSECGKPFMTAIGICDIMVRRIPLAILTGTFESVNISWSFTVFVLDTVGFPWIALDDAEGCLGLAVAEGCVDADTEDFLVLADDVDDVDMLYYSTKARESAINQVEERVVTI